jgi:type I restriction enzyme S subunit
MSIEIKYIPLSFINSDEEILKQIKNTVLFSYLFQTFEETSLIHYLQSTQYGYTASSSDSGTHQLVRITDINSGNVDWNTVPFCDCSTEEKYLLKDDDILVARTGGTTGKSFIVNDAPKNAVFASYLIRLRLKEDVNLEFINIYLNSYAYWSQIIEMKSGSAMPNVNAEKLKILKIPKLSFNEQNEFVAVVNNTDENNKFSFLFNKVNDVESLYVDSKKNTNELTHQLDLVKQLRQSFLREAMQGKLLAKDENANITIPPAKAGGYLLDNNTTFSDNEINRNGFQPILNDSNPIGFSQTGQQLLEKIKAEKAQLIADKKIKKEKPLPPISEEEIPFEIPEHWVWCRLGEIAEIKRGKSPKYSENGIFKMLNQKCVRWYNIEIKHSKAIDEVWYNSISNDLKIDSKDLLVNSTGDGTIGRSGIADVLCQDFMFDSHILRVRSLMQINQQLLCNIINSAYGQSLIESIKGATSTKQTELGVNNLSNFSIPLPPLHEQEQIVAKLEELMGFCDGLEQSIKESQEYNEMLLQQVLREALQGEEI